MRQSKTYSEIVSFFKLLFFIDRAPQDEINRSDDKQFQENVLRVRVLREEFKPMMTTSIRSELRRAGLKIDCSGLYGHKNSIPGVETPWTTHKPLSCPVTVLCNDIDPCCDEKASF